MMPQTETPVQMHPILLEATLHVSRDQNGLLTIPAEGLAAIKQDLDSITDAGQLRSAVESLVDLSSHLNNDASGRGAASALLDIVATTAPRLKQLQQTFHVLALEAAMMISQDERGALSIAADGLAKLGEELAAIAEKSEFDAAAKSLVDMAAHIKLERKDPDVAKLLLDVVLVASARRAS